MKTRLKTVAILALLGTPSYIFCAVRHICMAGHMCHGPFPWYHYANDLWWALCFVAVSVFSFRLRAKHKRIFLYGCMFLVLSRSILQSSGGGGEILELPLLIIIDAVAFRYLLMPDKYSISCEQEDSAGC